MGNRRLITGVEVARLTGLSVRTIRARGAETAEIPRVKIGRCWWYVASAVEAWVEARIDRAGNRKVLQFRRQA